MRAKKPEMAKAGASGVRGGAGEHDRYFVAVLPPGVIAQEVERIQQIFADHFASCGALRSPPHITLQPPFEWPAAEREWLEDCLLNFADKQPRFVVALSGFAAFPPRVIYIDVVANAALEALQISLAERFERVLGVVERSRSRRYVPHMTVAFRDLTQENFARAWPQFKDRPLSMEFAVHRLTLLMHGGGRWQVCKEFALQP
ncbi:gll1082 [Gloeobacter violaceus PCC 7421]|uniref:Gll1082 protein n=2 Tax=Gloeobacter violaceus TaxID=33072 RepID=Q7NLN9_GLOVI|nr:gll1082 [Gloeobacter violaceus PCC 7421]